MRWILWPNTIVETAVAEYMPIQKTKTYFHILILVALIASSARYSLGQAVLPGGEIIKALYQAHQPWSQPEKHIDFGNQQVISQYFDEPLTQLLLRDDDCNKKTREICAIDSDFIYNAQDGEPDNSQVTVKPCTPDSHSQYCVRTPKSKRDIRYTVKQTPAGWRISDIEDYDNGKWYSLKQALSQYQFYPKDK